MIRDDQPDLVYKTEEAKFNAVVDDIAERHEKGQPVLVGTVSVEKSELLSALLKKRGVPHEVLNAKQHEREAAIVAQAGRKGAVTVATNMAGRGTDIMLGGNPEFLADHELRSAASTRSRPRRSTRRPGPRRVEAGQAAGRGRARRGHRARRALRARHRAARVAPHRQPAARPFRPAGRPGRVPVLPVAADDLMRLFNAAMVETVHDPVQHPRGRADRVQDGHPPIQSAQTQVEAQNFEIRKNVLKYDEVLNRQRTVIYDERRRVLEGEDLHEQVRHMIDDVVEGYVDGGHRRGLRRGLGPRPALDRAQARSTRSRVTRRRARGGRRRRPVAG